jgi:hypothetical protein
MEIWKDVPGYEGYYQISNKARIKRMRHTIIANNGVTRIMKGRILKQTLSSGYWGVTLSKLSVSKFGSIHRIVADVFIPNPNNLPEVNHKNGIRTDNRLENLEFVTSSRNIQHAYDSGFCSRNIPVIAMHLHTKEVKNYNSCSDAARDLKLHRQSVARTAEGKYRYTGNWTFKKQKTV